MEAHPEGRPEAARQIIDEERRTVANVRKEAAKQADKKAAEKEGEK